MSTSLDRRAFLGLSAGTLGLALTSRSALASLDDAPSIDDLTKKAVNFLKPRQSADGSWSSDKNEPGITALVLTGLLKSTLVDRNEPVITKGLGYLEGLIGPMGGISEPKHGNYASAVGLMAFKEANKDGKYDSRISACQAYIKTAQWDEDDKKTKADVIYGGAGYGGKDGTRPDLSNTAFMIESLRDSGLPADDPALQKAMVFVSRSQNLKSEFNDQPWADKVNDGGFIYTPALGGVSVAGKDEATGGLRSYGSMTYAGLKSMIYAGLKADDPRVKAATTYIRKHYSLEDNPGLDQRGLYYYYQTFSKTLSLVGEDPFVDDKGTKHDWRAELVAALAKRQAENGSWVNKVAGFMEGDPNLVTAYSLLALAYARPKK